jgi:hypothetical protein
VKNSPLQQGQFKLMINLRLALLTTFALLVTLPAEAGERRQLATDLKCIRTIAPGLPLLSGIPTGKLSKHIYIQRCSDMWLSSRIRNGRSQSWPVQAAFIPKYRARQKPFATPDARVTINNKAIREAWLTRPTRRYDHAILGDEIEGGALAVALPSGRKIEYVLDENSVFEDRMARLVDLDGDGRNEIVLVQSTLDGGAALAIYGLDNEQIVKLTQTSSIGLTHRWLNPAVAADFDGDGQVEIAYVETPHTGGILKIVRLQKDGRKYWLQSVATLAGFSNHKMGSQELQQAVTFDWNGDGSPDIILPGAARQTIKVVSLDKGTLQIIDSMKIGGQIDSPLIAADLNGDDKGEVILVTKDGRLLSFSPDKK